MLFFGAINNLRDFPASKLPISFRILVHRNRGTISDRLLIPLYYDKEKQIQTYNYTIKNIF